MRSKKMKKTLSSTLAFVLLAGAIPFTQIEILHANVSLNDVNRKIDGSNFRSIAVKQDGTVWTWGVDAGDFINNTTSTSTKTPEPVPGLTNVVEVEDGYMHTVALKADGTIWSWGYNSSAQFGNGGYTNSATPVQVSNVTGLPTNIIDVATGASHTLALTSTGEVWIWGSGYSGELGLGSNTKSTAYPQKIPTLSGIVQIDAKNGTSYAIKNDGTVWTWGANDYGQIGNGNSTDQFTPYQVPGFSGAAKLSAGYNFVTVLKTNGTVWGWGEAQSYQLGNGAKPTYQYTPVQASGISGVIDLDAGSSHVLALKSDGTVWTWGQAYDGLAGNYTYTTWNMTPASVPITGVVAVATGDRTSLAVKSDGSIWAWGQVSEYDSTNKNYVMADHPVMIDFSMLPDTTPPVPATFTASTTALTNQNVSVTINYPTDGTVKEYKIGATGTWMTYSAPVVMSANDTVYARSKDAAGNVSAESSYAVTNIDKVGPVSPSLLANITTPTNQNVVVTVSYPGDASQAQYKIGTGSWQTYSAPITLTANSTVYARAIDAAGNIGVEGSINITNIDKTAPTAPTMVADRTAMTNQNVNVTITYSGDSTVKEYRVGASGSWLSYEGAVVMESNDTVYARSFDAAGNQSPERSLVVNNIDKIVPVAPVMIADKTTETNTNVNVTITFPSDASQKQYKVGSTGTWTTYTSPVSISTNTTVYSRAIDAAGNLSSEASLVISNIDKTAPIVATLSVDKTALTSQGVKVTVSFPADAEVKEYKIGETGTWMTYVEPITVEQNTTVYARSKDKAGNQSAESNIVVNNVDKTAPTKPTASVNKNVLSITPGTDASGVDKTEYQLNGGVWQTYTDVVTLEDGQYTINVRTIDKAGNASAVTVVTANVDTVSIEEATKAVEEAELAHTQAKVNTAQALVNELPQSQEKTSLQQRLDVVQSNINLYNAIQTEITAMNTDVDRGDATAQEVQTYKNRVVELRDDVNSLPDVMNKPFLHQQLDELMAKLMLIEKIIIKDDDGIEDVDLDELQDEVDKLPDSDLKDQLQDELDQDKLLQDAIKKVEQAESSKTQSDVDVAREAVSKLPDGEKKDELNERLDAIQKQIDDEKAIADATQKVVEAETTKNQADVDTARDAVNKLPDGSIKDDLNDRLDAIQEEIDNSNNGGNDGGDNSSDPYTDVDQIKDPVVKAILSDAKTYVELAEKHKSRTWIINALEKVEAIPSTVKENPLYAVIVNDLTARINKVKDDYNNAIADQELQQKITVATTYVTQYEKYKSSYYKTKAQTAVSALPDGEVKTSLQARIDAVASK